MKALRINEFVGENGIQIEANKLLDFKNRNVEIIILPSENQKVSSNKENFFKAAGKIKLDSKEIDTLRDYSPLS